MATKQDPKFQPLRSNIIQFTSVSMTRDRNSYAIRIGKNILFLHKNFLKAVEASAKKKGSR